MSRQTLAINRPEGVKRQKIRKKGKKECNLSAEAEVTVCVRTLKEA